MFCDRQGLFQFLNQKDLTFVEPGLGATYCQTFLKGEDRKKKRVKPNRKVVDKLVKKKKITIDCQTVEKFWQKNEL